MAKYRAIYQKIWKDPDFQLYTPEAKLLFIYLCTNDSTSESGIYTITVTTIANETGIPSTTVEQLLANGLKNVAYDLDNHCIYLKKFRRYNAGGRPELIAKSVVIDANLTYKSKLWLDFANEYPEFNDCLKPILQRLPNGSPSNVAISIPITISNPISNPISIPNDNKENNHKEIDNVYDYWNSKDIIVHQKQTEEMKRKIRSALKNYDIDTIKKSIDNYSQVLRNPQLYYFNHEWTLGDYLHLGMEKFMDNAKPLTNYLKTKPNPIVTNDNPDKFTQGRYGNQVQT